MFANNQHPIQLHTYNEYNTFLKEIHDVKEAETQEDLAARFDEVAESRDANLNKADGESFSIDELSEIYMQVKAEHRDQTNMSLTTRDKKGDISDYLESRRPFGAEVSKEWSLWTTQLQWNQIQVLQL